MCLFLAKLEKKICDSHRHNFNADTVVRLFFAQESAWTVERIKRQEGRGLTAIRDRSSNGSTLMGIK